MSGLMRVARGVRVFVGAGDVRKFMEICYIGML